MNENIEDPEPLPSTSTKLLSGNALLQIHVNASRNLPKDGSKEFSPTNTWMEKKQIQSALDERKELLEEERVEKWGSLAGAKWDQKKKLAEVTRRNGKYFQTLGFEKEGTLYLYPEEALYLLEMNSLELTFGGVPMSIQQGYSLLLGNSTGCTLNEYRTYSHLVRQGYKLLRFTNQQLHTKYERTIRLDQHAPLRRSHPGQLQIKCEVSSEREHSKLKTEEDSQMRKSFTNQSQNKSLKKESDVNDTNEKLESLPRCKSEKDVVQYQGESKHRVAKCSFPEINQTKTPSPHHKHEEAQALDSDNAPHVSEQSAQAHQDSEGIHESGGRNQEESSPLNENVTREEEDGLSREKVEKRLGEPSLCHGDGNSQELVEFERSSEENKLLDGNPRKTHDHFETNNVGQTVSEDNQSSSTENVANKAYDIAESLLCLGNVLMEEQADSERSLETKLAEPNNLSMTLQTEIVKVLGAHFEKGVSKEALKELASSAADTILSHISPSKSNQAKCSHENNVDLVNQQQDVKLPSESKLNNVTQIDSKHCNVQKSVTAVNQTKPALTSDIRPLGPIPSYSVSDSNDSDAIDQKSYARSPPNSLYPKGNLTPESELSSKEKEYLQRKVGKRPGSSDGEADDDCEPVLIKKAKMMNVCDSEIEIIDFVPEKKEVELVNLSDEASMDSMHDHKADSNDGSTNDDNNSIEVIDIHDSSSNENSNTSSDLSSGSDDSSVICEEAQSISWEEERRRILDTFPNMYNLTEMSLEPPNADLLPQNVQPQRRKYIISRWKLNKEGRQIKNQYPHSQILPQSQLPLGSPCNFLAQNISDQLWQQNVPINPVAAVQAIAQLVLPMFGLSPSSCPPEQMWLPKNSWFPPRSIWNHGPRFNHHPPRGNRWQRFRPRPYGFRHHNPRYQRRGSNHHHSYNQNNPKQMTDNQPRNEVIPIQSTSNAEIEERCGNENFSTSHRPWQSWMQQNKIERGGKPKRLNKRGLSRGRYFNPPRKYSHMKSLARESLEYINLKSDDSAVTNEKNNCSNIKSESDSSGEDSIGNDSANVDNSDETAHSASSDSTDGTKSSCNSPLEIKPLLSPLDCTNFGAVFKMLQVTKSADTESLISTVCESSLRPQFDLFLPTKSFKKGNLPVPDFHLCIVSHDGAVPHPGEIRALCDALDDNVPIMFALVSPDSISFIQFCDVNLPSSTTQL